MFIERKRALLGTIALACLSCAQRPQTSGVGLAPPVVAVSGVTASAISDQTLLTLEDAPRILEVKPMSEAKQLDAEATCSSDGKYVLEIPEGTFPKIARGTYIVRAGASRRLVLKGTGFYARWVSETEVAFIDATGQLMKLDVTLPHHATRGTQVCGSVLECESSDPPRLEWVSRQLKDAVLRGATGEMEPFVVRKGEVVGLAAELRREIGFKILALRVNKIGTLCGYMVRLPGQERRPISNIDAKKGRLLCADSPWTTWRNLRDFSVDWPVDRVDEGVRVMFFSEREVVVSLPASKAPTQNETYRHCIVSLDTAMARCTPTARPEWFPLGDGRWLVEATVVSSAPGHLIDIVHARSWAIGNNNSAVWWEPHRNSRDPGALVLQREDMADVRAGIVVLPADP